MITVESNKALTTSSSPTFFKIIFTSKFSKSTSSPSNTSLKTLTIFLNSPSLTMLPSSSIVSSHFMSGSFTTITSSPRLSNKWLMIELTLLPSNADSLINVIILSPLFTNKSTISSSFPSSSNPLS